MALVVAAVPFHRACDLVPVFDRRLLPCFLLSQIRRLAAYPDCPDCLDSPDCPLRSDPDFVPCFLPDLPVPGLYLRFDRGFEVDFPIEDFKFKINEFGLPIIEKDGWV